MTSWLTFPEQAMGHNGTVSSRRQGHLPLRTSEIFQDSSHVLEESIDSNAEGI